jgi:hypothetical protein
MDNAMAGRSGELTRMRSRGEAAAFCSLAILMIMVIIWPSWNASFALPADTLWLMHAAKELLSGKVLYRDIIETNPPMSVLIYLPGMWMADLTNISAKAVIVAQTLAMAAVSAALTMAALRRSYGLSHHQSLGMGVALVFALIVLPNNQFSQREHAALMLLLPYIAIMAARAEARPIPGLVFRFSIAVMAGMAASIKPHFLIVPVIMTLVAAVATRSPRVLWAMENVTGGLVFAFYWSVVFLFFPAFRSDVWPILSDLYLAESSPALTLLLQAYMAKFIQYFVVLLMFTLLIMRSKKRALIWFAPVLGFLIAFLVQGKGYIYHFYPVAGLAALAMAMMALTQEFHKAAWRPMAFAACALAMILGTLSQKEAYPLPDIVERLQAFPKGTPLLVVSEELQRSVTVAAEAELHWASRLHTRWMTQIANSELSLGSGALERQELLQHYLEMDRRILLQDIENGRPPLLVFDHAPKDWEAIMRKDPAIDRAMNAYRFAGQFDHGRMSLYIRSDTPLP